MKRVDFQDLGFIPYQEALKKQSRLFKEIVAIKRHNKYHPEALRNNRDYLLFCEHPPVYTLGKSGHLSNLLVDEARLQELGIEYFQTNRGGDITFHGPGQVVGYPILNLDHFFKDISKYMRTLEEIVILTLEYFGLKAGRLPGATGVWLDPEDPSRARKICAMGVRSSRWVTMHGWALNVNTDLHYFDYIIPCGITDKAVTSMQKELGHPVDMQEVKKELMVNFGKLFSCRLIEA